MKNYINRMNSLSPNKQESINLLISAIFPVILLLLLLFGVTSSGEFKNSLIKWMVESLLTDKTLWGVLLFAIPVFTLFLLKALILGVPNLKVFNWVAQLLTGVFYSFGLSIIVLAFTAPKYGHDLNMFIIIMGLATTLVGCGLYYIFQVLIQRKINPSIES